MIRWFRAFLLVLCFASVLQVFSPHVLAAFQSTEPAESSEGFIARHELLFETINFLLLVGFFVYLYRKRGRAFFNERSEYIRRSLEESREALERSQAKLAEAEAKLAGLQGDVQALKKQAETEIGLEMERIRQAAEDEARRIEEFAKARITAATNAAKLELKKFVVEQTIEQARGKIQQRLDGENRRKLVGFFLSDLRAKSKGI
jgi:F0F1-type ATP synthase membrane subunit b/b'